MVLNGTVLVSEEQIRDYRENGFVQVNNVLNEQELAELRGYIDDVMGRDGAQSIQTDRAGGAYYSVLNQRVNTWRDHGGIARFVLSRRFAEIGRQLTGFSGIRLFHDHALLKMPHDSKPTPWHQDYPYWPMQDPGAFSIWIALDDVDERNGCMAFVPKTQKIRNLKHIDLVNPQDIFESVDTDKNNAVIVRMKAGSCTFHDGLTFHYAHANTTDKPRRVLAVIYMPEGTVYNGKSHLCTSFYNLKPGTVLNHGLFPRLA